ncbi:MAG: 30S ribosomal protein S18 [Spirochaetes bacterium GWB1_36_13]|nr:MAG: 30S ribosomal protein S18 [Spirochaetes bacterium GWB1_36_13]
MQKRVQIPRFVFKKKKCRFCKMDIDFPDFKDIDILSKYVTEKGKILPRRINGCCEKHQRRVKTAIKQARYMALLPFVKKETAGSRQDFNR